MKRAIFTVLFLLFSCFLSQATFADYSDLIGREIALHGPYSWQRLGVALNEKMADDLVYAYRMRDKTAFLGMLESYDVLRVTKDTKVLVLDAEVFKGKAHVVLTSGFYKGMSGWVPIEWLKGNDRHYLIGEAAEESKI
jgi:hypothetical protein